MEGGLRVATGREGVSRCQEGPVRGEGWVVGGGWERGMGALESPSRDVGPTLTHLTSCSVFVRSLCIAGLVCSPLLLDISHNRVMMNKCVKQAKH